MLPPIRYPLPTILALVIGALITWRGEAWTRAWRADLSAGVRRVIEGPPVPLSNRPEVVAGPITRRALLLRDETPAASRPGGPTVETIDRRMFVDIYDAWPSPGPTTHLRVGNRRPIGWIAAAGALAWDTRLVVRADAGRLTLADVADDAGGVAVDVGRAPLPVLAWDKRGAVEVAVWDPTRPWSAVSRRGWVRASDLPPGAWGVWISQVELPILLRQALAGDPAIVRLRAVLGRLADNRPLTRADLEAARPALPPIALEVGPDSRAAAGQLAEANARPVADAGWSGLTFRFLPLGDLP